MPDDLGHLDGEVMRRINNDQRQRFTEILKKTMAKISETDKRPRHTFNVGDIVRYHPSFKAHASGEGIILGIENLQVSSASAPIRQRCHCFFAPTALQLKRAARRIMKRKFYEAEYKSMELATIENSRLEYVRDCPPLWLQPITTMEIHIHRFSDLLEEED